MRVDGEANLRKRRAHVIAVFWALALVLGGTLFGVTLATAGPERGLRLAGGMALALVCAWLWVRYLLRRSPPRPSLLADVLTLSRLVSGCALAGYVVSGVSREAGLISWLVWLLVIYAASISDWLDGPIARKAGDTPWGKPLDIESDSWLTFWCALAAIFVGGLPWFVLAPPLLHYAFPIIELRAGNLPKGGKPDLSRVTGIAHMVLLIAAFAPVSPSWREPLLAIAVWPVSGGQCVTMLVLLWQRLRQAPPEPVPVAVPGDAVQAGSTDTRRED